ncbi:hypothetical protein C8R46DRAFT_1124513 [Mycena filopes]|nr:hypothetical protein C8R46DRAFT_1124513 [Mycena filopes]
MPSLPIELQRQIVVTTIRTNHKDRVVKLNLSLVAHHFHSWVERVFYESVGIDNSEQMDQFLNLMELKPAGFFATTVEALRIPYFTEMDRVLAACSGLALMVGFPLPRVPQVNSLSLRRLCVDTAEILDNNSTVQPTWCSTLTHLDLGFVHVEFNLQSAEMLGRLPCLTNVALNAVWTDRPLVDAVCASCPNLRVLVIFTMDEEHDAEEYRDVSRVVLCNATTFDEDWDAGLFSGLPDFWIRAENVVAGRQARTQAQSSS